MDRIFDKSREDIIVNQLWIHVFTDAVSAKFTNAQTKRDFNFTYTGLDNIQAMCEYADESDIEIVLTTCDLDKRTLSNLRSLTDMLMK